MKEKRKKASKWQETFKTKTLINFFYIGIKFLNKTFAPGLTARGTGTSAKHCSWMFSVCVGRSQFYLSYAQDVLVRYIVNVSC